MKSLALILLLTLFLYSSSIRIKKLQSSKLLTPNYKVKTIAVKGKSEPKKSIQKISNLKIFKNMNIKAKSKISPKNQKMQEEIDGSEIKNLETLQKEKEKEHAISKKTKNFLKEDRKIYIDYITDDNFLVYNPCDIGIWDGTKCF